MSHCTVWNCQILTQIAFENGLSFSYFHFFLFYFVLKKNYFGFRAAWIDKIICFLYIKAWKIQ